MTTLSQHMKEGEIKLCISTWSLSRLNFSLGTGKRRYSKAPPGSPAGWVKHILKACERLSEEPLNVKRYNLIILFLDSFWQTPKFSKSYTGFRHTLTLMWVVWLKSHVTARKFKDWCFSQDGQLFYFTWQSMQSEQTLPFAEKRKSLTSLLLSVAPFIWDSQRAA